MPSLDTKLHLDMLWEGRRSRGFLKRLKSAAEALFKNDVYGLEWGDPEVVPPLAHIRDHFLKPYISPDTTMVEIGPGGGRWTRYMLHAKHIYAVDYHQEILDTLRSNLHAKNITYITNNGDDFPGVPKVDFIFSFGAFVHLDIDIIDRYLKNMKPLLKPETNVVIHYADKTKPLGQQNKGFSDNNPERMIALIQSHGYTIIEDDRGTLWHSSIVRFGLPTPN